MTLVTPPPGTGLVFARHIVLIRGLMSHAQLQEMIELAESGINELIAAQQQVLA